jgi:hypothetical protein
METDEDEFSPPLLSGLQRGDSNRSWTASQVYSTVHIKRTDNKFYPFLFSCSILVLLRFLGTVEDPEQ